MVGCLIDVVAMADCWASGYTLRCGLLAELFALGSVAWILSIMSNCSDPYHLRKYAKKEMDGKPLQIAASTPCPVEMMSLGELSCVFNSLGKFKPK